VTLLAWKTALIIAPGTLIIVIVSFKEMAFVELISRRCQTCLSRVAVPDTKSGTKVVMNTAAMK
jgi:hypothetical protein